jgi:hypothetical protein
MKQYIDLIKKIKIKEMKKLILTILLSVLTIPTFSGNGGDDENKSKTIKDKISHIHYPSHIKRHRDIEKVFIDYKINDQNELIIEEIHSTHKDFEKYVYDNLYGLNIINPTKRDGVIVIKFKYFE